MMMMTTTTTVMMMIMMIPQKILASVMRDSVESGMRSIRGGGKTFEKSHYYPHRTNILRARVAPPPPTLVFTHVYNNKKTRTNPGIIMKSIHTQTDRATSEPSATLQ